MKTMNNLEINKSDLYSDNNFQLSSIDHLGHKLNRGKDPNQAISILLFDLTPDSKINNLYLLEQMDYMDQSTCLSCLVEDVNPTLDDDDYDTFKRCINKELGIQNLINLDACYFLGKVDHKIPFSKTYNCYALCVNDYIKTPDGFKLDLPESEISNSRYSLKKMKFSRAIKGECKDSLVLSSCMLLLSYIS
jgi:hypothetical protein